VTSIWLGRCLGAFAQALMSAQASAVCGAGCNERSEERVNSRNGYRTRDWDTRVGTIELAVRDQVLATPTRPRRRCWHVEQGETCRPIG